MLWGFLVTRGNQRKVDDPIPAEIRVDPGSFAVAGSSFRDSGPGVTV